MRQYLLALLYTISWQGVHSLTECVSLRTAQNEKFETLYQWNYLNFTWPSPQVYKAALASGEYVPANNAIVGVKYYDERLYLALPKVKPGSPVTLAYVPLTPQDDVGKNVLLKPYPNWMINTVPSCHGLRNVQSMEIDRKGIMWVLDGRRVDNETLKCPPKIVLLDLNRGGLIIQTYTVPQDVCDYNSCFLNDIVVEEIDGGYAYITDTSSDPGLVVYSRLQNRAWKVRDSSMFPEPEAENVTFQGHSAILPVDGIAMAPQASLDDPHRTVYYTPFTGYSMYGIDSSVLRNRKLATSSRVHEMVQRLGRKLDLSDGMVMDSERQLYYGIVNQDSVAKWDFSVGSTDNKIIDRNPELIQWPDSFGFDTFGTLYLVADNIANYMFNNISTNSINFRILKLYTGTCSYQF